MAAAAKGTGGVTPTPSDKLEDQAATAALYVTKDKGKSSHAVLDEDGKLSSASAATSLKYAKPQDLPSFPSPGLQVASAGAAASLADMNKRSVDVWKPGPIPSAGKAAYRAKDYEAEPLWQPEKSDAGSKAALIAADKGAHVNTWKARESNDGHSAAEQAARRNVATPTDHRAGVDGNRKALMAATGAMASSRRRAGSAPVEPINSPPGVSATPGTLSQSQWALKAAAQSQRTKQSSTSAGSRDQGWEAAKVQNIAQGNVSRQMYTSHPPVSPEVEERNRQDTLRASAVAMAQKMYSIQQQAIDEAKADITGADSQRAARNVHNRRNSDASSLVGTPEPLASPLYSSTLQEAAQRRAHERLAKMRNEREEYGEYYGQKPSTTRSRLSIHGRLRRRASSDGAADSLDEKQSRKIRSQMSRFQSNLAAVDDKKREQDRGALLTAAQRNVKASMHSMDEEVFQETGKSSPAQQEAWASKARERAQVDSNARMEHFGKVHIGAGKYLEQADVDTVAKNRLQPTLDDIDEKAETQRAREAEQRLEREARKQQAELEKQRAADIKAEQKKAREEQKQQDKTRKAEDKKAQREELALSKKKENETKEQTKEAPHNEEEGAKAKDKAKGLLSTLRISTHGGSAGVAVSQDDQTISSPGKANANESRPGSSASSQRLGRSSDVEQAPPTANPQEGDALTSPSSTTKGHSKVKSWFAERFRHSSKSAKDGDDGDRRNAGFVGSAGSSNADAGEDKPREASIRDVAMAGRSNMHESTMQSPTDRSVSPISGSQERKAAEIVSISSSSDHGEGESSAAGNQDATQRGRLGLKQRILGKTSSKTSHKATHDKHAGSNESDSDDGDDEFTEARDAVEDDLEPPPKLTSAKLSSKASASPVRDSKFSENL